MTWGVGTAVTPLAGFVLFPVIAMALGIGQAFVLAPRLTRGWIWPYVFATLLAGTVSLWIFVRYALFRFEDDLWRAVGCAALSGAVLGLGQALALKPARLRLLAWTLGGVLGALGAWGAFRWLLDVGTPVGFLFGTAAGLALGQTLGLALLLAANRTDPDVTAREA